MKPFGVWIAVCCIWSTSYVAIKLGVHDVPPIGFAGVRFVLAVTILLFVLVVQRRPFPHAHRDWLLMGSTGVLFFTINYGLLFSAQQYISAGLAAVFQATMPAWGVVLAHYYVPTERITRVKVGVIALGILGVTIIFVDQLHLAGRHALVGSAAVVVGAVAVAYTNVLIKVYGSHLHPTTLITGQMLCGTLPLVLVGLMTEGNPMAFQWTGVAIVALVYLTLIGSVAALVLYYWLLNHMDLTKVTVHAVVTPLLTMLLSTVVLGERLHWTTVLGAGCILASVGFSLTRGDSSK